MSQTHRHPRTADRQARRLAEARCATSRRHEHAVVRDLLRRLRDDGAPADAFWPDVEEGDDR